MEDKKMRKSIARCTNCGVRMETRDMIATRCNNRRKDQFAYMCPHCATHNEDYRSSREMVEVGKIDNGWKYGIELETSDSTPFFRNMMFRFGFKATHDGSLNSTGDDERYTTRYGWTESSCEYVSSTNCGLKRFTKQFGEIEKSMLSRDVDMDDSCGTHCHISYNDMEGNVMDKIRIWYYEIFHDMQEIMREYPSCTENFFGRYFNCSFAEEIREGIDWNDHDSRYHWINLTNDTNVEFRINKFVSGSQMLECIKFEQWVIKTVIDNFTDKYDTDNNEVIARKTGKKLARKLKSKYEEMLFA